MTVKHHCVWLAYAKNDRTTAKGDTLLKSTLPQHNILTIKNMIQLLNAM